MKKLCYLVLIIAAVGLAALALLVLKQRPPPIGDLAGFETLGVRIRDYDLFDLGVADGNGDGRLDIFTANHSSPQSLLLGDGAGGFTEAYSQLGLDQDRRFPALEDALEAPVTDVPGLYIYRQARWLHLAAHDIDPSVEVRGRLTLPWPIEIGEAPSTVDLSRVETGDGRVTTTLDFSLRGNEQIRLIGREDIVELPHTLTLASDVDLARVFVGRQKVNPAAHRFDMTWRDRHGMAFADYDGDGFVDLFIARGGVKGQLDKVGVPVMDELFVGSGARFSDRAAQAALKKGNCPARQSSWVDFDADGDLDLYVSCGRGNVAVYPNLLFRQDDNHRFDEVATRFGLGFGQASVYSWLDIDSDADPDLVAAEGGRIYLYRNQGGLFEKSQVVQDWLAADPYQFAMSDFDNDGDLDLYAAHRNRSLLLVNTGDTFAPGKPADIGLPNGARAAAWVDFDNDGLVDLHTIPGGVYRQGRDGRFTRTGILVQDGDIESISEAVSSWADFDDDGQRDLVIALQAGPTIAQRLVRRLTGRQPDLGGHWRSGVYRRADTGANHWLTIALDGPQGNAPAIGARVYVATASGRQMQQVGAAEGSHYGQGHYRLYFGVGDEAVADHVRVVWPDGRDQVIADVQADRLLHIRYAPD